MGLLKMPRFFVGQPIISGKKIEITKAEFESLRSARDSVVGLLRFENLYHVLFGSISEFERHILEATFQDSYRSFEAYQSHFELQIYFDHLRAEANVKMLALLSAARAYHDQRNQALGMVSGFEPKSVNDHFREEYDSSFNYRIFEALRNYSQHANLPIQSVSLSGDNLWSSSHPKADSPSIHRATIKPLIPIKELLADKAFKAPVSKELQGAEHLKLDARALARSYLASIAKRHLEVTESLGTARDEARDLMSDYMDRFLGEFAGRDVEHFSVWADDVDTKTWIGSTLTNKLERYQQAKKRHISIRRGYVSSEITADAKVLLSEFDDVWVR